MESFFPLIFLSAVSKTLSLDQEEQEDEQGGFPLVKEEEEDEQVGFPLVVTSPSPQLFKNRSPPSGLLT